MEKRSYNILFDLHTVSGIVISVLLYIIFFAGSFSFFRSEIIAWERSEHAGSSDQFRLNVDAALDTLEKEYTLASRDISIYQREGETRLSVYMSAPKDTLLGSEDFFFYIHPDSYDISEYEKSYTLGEFLYRLHFFAQIPYPIGYYLSGFTALFFLFAILTGVLVHWKKMISNFYLFRPWEKLKTIWTDAHTALGTIGLPFQFVYAVTGAFFMINILLVIPGLFVLYDGDETKLYNDLGFGSPVFKFENKQLDSRPGINELIAKTSDIWRSMHVNEVSIFNYGDAGMHVTIGGELEHEEKFTGSGEVTYKASTNEMVSQKDPYRSTSYMEGVQSAMYHLHFGNYGGLSVKGISFVLGLISCFVIITGILIWLESRKGKHIPEKQRRFNARVGHAFLAICLTMYPVTAFSFIVTRLVPHHMDGVRKFIVYSVYFGSWLLCTAFFIWKKDNFLTNKCSLISGAVLGAIVPIVNGIVTGNWFWITWRHSSTDIFVVDLLWMLISVSALVAILKLTRKKGSGVGGSDNVEEHKIASSIKGASAKEIHAMLRTKANPV